MAAGDITPGKRVRAERGFSHRLLAGEYGQHAHDHHWIGCTPNGHQCNLSRHEVVEHEDMTITVSPSLQFETGKRWHGYLEKGVWREC